MNKIEIQEFSSICDKLSSVNLNRVMEVATALKFTQENSNKNNYDSKKTIQPSA